MPYYAVPLAVAWATLWSQAQALQQSPPRNRRQEKEVALGAQLAAQVRRETTPLDLVTVHSYVERLGRQLAIQMPGAPEDWKFSVIGDRQSSSTYEPLSFPGGWMFIPAQLFLGTSSEGEFAGMLAHAMAHVAERQSTRRSSGDVTSLAAIPVVLGGGFAEFGGDGANTLLPVGSFKSHRQYELEADRIAVKVISSAGFDPNDLLNYIARAQPEHTKQPEELSPMPSLSARLGNMKQAIQSLSVSSTRRPPDSFASVQDEVRREVTRASTPDGIRRIPSLLHPERN